MPISRPSIRFLALALTAATASAAAPTEEKMDPAGLEFFEKNIRPILSERCYECHSKEKGVSKGDSSWIPVRGCWPAGTSVPPSSRAT